MAKRARICLRWRMAIGLRSYFCATGQSGLVRRLSSGEIIAQVLHMQRELATQGECLSNIVLMGMGEPLLNYDNAIGAIRWLADPRRMGFVQRRITLSTIGIPAAIHRLARENLQIGLAVSVQAATDGLRNRLAPISRQFPLNELFAAMRT